MKYTVSNYLHQMETLMKEADLENTQSTKLLFWVSTVYGMLAEHYPTEDILERAINNRDNDAILNLFTVLLWCERIINMTCIMKGGKRDDYGHIDDYLAFLKDTYDFKLKIDPRLIDKYC